jgi:hypothetical protein
MLRQIVESDLVGIAFRRELCFNRLLGSKGSCEFPRGVPQGGLGPERLYHDLVNG